MLDQSFRVYVSLMMLKVISTFNINTFWKEKQKWRDFNIVVLFNIININQSQNIFNARCKLHRKNDFAEVFIKNLTRYGAENNFVGLSK